MQEFLVCPSCNNKSFTVKYEATYVYSYVMDADAPGLKNTQELMPFMFDNREQKESKQYLECNSCGSRYPCFYNEAIDWTDYSQLQKAINSHYVSNL